MIGSVLTRRCSGRLRRSLNLAVSLQELMDTQNLLTLITPADLVLEATPLVMWEMGAASTEDDVARFMYRGGSFPPQASLSPPPAEDHRPEKKYWDYVKLEMRALLCTDDKKYRALWKQVSELQKKSTATIVSVIAAFLGASIGASATLLAGFVAICLFGVLKLGKEAYCGFTSKNEG